MRRLLDVLDGAQALIHLCGTLREIADLHRLADGDRAARRRPAPRDEVQERRLARAVAAEDGGAVMAQHRIGKVPYDGAPVRVIAHMIELDDRAAEAAALETDLHRRAVEVGRLIFHRFVARDARFLLRRARLCAAAQPLELVPEEILPLRLACLLALDARRFLLEERGVISRVRVGTALVEFENARRRVIEEIAVVRDHEQRALARGEILLEPGDRLAVEVVCRLVEQQQIGGLHERRREREALLLAA